MYNILFILELFETLGFQSGTNNILEQMTFTKILKETHDLTNFLIQHIT